MLTRMNLAINPNVSNLALRNVMTVVLAAMMVALPLAVMGALAGSKTGSRN